MKDRAPDYPPTRIVIEVPLDGEPSVVEDGGLAGYFVGAVLNRLLDEEEAKVASDPSGGCE